METPKKSLGFRKRKPKKILYISGKRNFLYISGNETFLNFGKGIFKTLVCSKPKTYSEHFQTSTMERFAKIATWCAFQPQAPKLFSKKIPKKPALKRFFIFSQKKVFLIFSQKGPCTFWHILWKICFAKVFYIFSKNLSNFLGKKTLKKSLYFRKWNFV